ncbi:MAG: hypothetical protein H0Z38_06945 [Firmicutes bacterium]|nr:hypothetical protein [Bacillota bacterium]
MGTKRPAEAMTMKRFFSVSLRALQHKAALLFLGVLVGAGLAYPWSCQRIHRLTQEVHRLETEAASLKDQLKKYEELLGRRDTVQADRIVFIYRNKVPDYVKNVVERGMRDRLSPHIGKDLAKLDPLLLEQALDGQVFTVEQTQWEVEIRSIRITDRLEFSLALKEK